MEKTSKDANGFINIVDCTASLSSLMLTAEQS